MQARIQSNNIEKGQHSQNYNDSLRKSGLTSFAVLFEINLA